MDASPVSAFGGCGSESTSCSVVADLNDQGWMDNRNCTKDGYFG